MLLSRRLFKPEEIEALWAYRQSERQHILAVLARTRFDKRKAARILGISLASLYRKLGERRISNSPLRD